MHASFYIHKAWKLVQLHCLRQICYPVRYRNRTFQKLKSILYRIMMFTSMKQTSIDCAEFLFCTTTWGESALITAGMSACMFDFFF